jgi:predicted permease
VLAASQVALSLVLLIGSGLLGKSFYQLLRVDPGFDARQVLTMSVAVPGILDSETDKRRDVFREITERAAAAPGVESAGAINHLPLAGDTWGLSFTIAGRPVPAAGEVPGATWRSADPGYFRAMKLRLMKGRLFGEQDSATALPVAVINSNFARRYFAAEEPIGQRIRIGDPAGDSPLLEIVGVVGNVKQQNWAEDAEPEMYVPLSQNQLWRMTRRVTLVARAAGGPNSIVAPLREAVSSAYKDAVISEEMTMEQVASQAVSQPRFQTLLLGMFAGAAILLAAIGIYGIIAHSASTRVREMGIRQALGANRSHLLRLVVSQGAKLALAGILIGLATGRALSGFVESLVYQVSPADWSVYLVSALFLAAVALLASYVPARRASRVDPMVALRID